MKTLKFDTEEEWFEARKGKITGSRLKDIVVKRGTGYKKGFWQMIADQVATEPEEERPLDRGRRLECEAIERFEKEYDKKVDKSLIIWTRDEDESIAISPDGVVLETEIPDLEACEVKCLNSAAHIEAWFTKEIPDEYEFQKLQYFIANDTLKTLYWIFYDPRIKKKDFFVIEIHRKDVQAEVDIYLEYERKTLVEIRNKINELTF